MKSVKTAVKLLVVCSLILIGCGNSSAQTVQHAPSVNKSIHLVEIGRENTNAGTIVELWDCDHGVLLYARSSGYEGGITAVTTLSPRAYNSYC